MFILVRMATAGLFLAHAVVRILSPESITSFSRYLAGCGFPFPTVVVWAITLCELTAGAMLILRLQVRLAAAVLIAIVVEGIVLIHGRQGWFVGEHGAGGCEYSIALIILLLVVAAEDAARRNSSSPV